MEDMNAEPAEKKKRTFMGHLQKVEIWLLDVLKNPEINEKIMYSREIQESCNVLKDLKEVLLDGMTFEKQIMIVVPMVNALVHVYTVDKSGIITSQEYFQSIVTVFTKMLLQIRNDILGYDTGSTTDTFDSRSMKFATDALLQECATNILDSLLTNFAKGDLLKKCFELFFPNEAKPSTGNVIYECSCDKFRSFIIVAKI